MILYIFLYNVVAIKSSLSNLVLSAPGKFILIGSDYCLQNLSEENRQVFDKTYPIQRNFHRVDSKEVEAILLNYLSDYGPENIRLLTNEDSTQLVCAELREKYGIPGTSTEQLLPYVNKVISKSKLEGKVRIPRYMSFDKKGYRKKPKVYLDGVIAKIGFPMFIKPVDLVSSIDTYYIDNATTLQTVLDTVLSRSWDFEIDEFIEGDLFHCDAIIHRGKMEFFMAGKYAWPLAKFSKGRPMGSIPVNEEGLLAQLKKISEDVFTCLGTFSSAFHLEVFKEKKSGELIFLEAAARTPGALVPNMYQIIFNMHLEALHYEVQMIVSDCNLKIEKTESHAAWVTFPKIDGNLAEIRKPKIAIKNTVVNFVQLGEEMKQAESLLDGSLSIVFWDKSYPKSRTDF